MDVSVVITCWNGKRLLEKNFPSVVKASENPRNKIKEILVVDDGSTDDSVAFLRQYAIRNTQYAVRIVQHNRNYGYSRTCNTGVKEAKGDLVAILNLDVIPSEDFLEEALPHFQDKKVFAVSFNEGKFGPGKVEWKKGFLDIVPSVPANETSLTDWPNGGSSIFRKRIWEELNGMDKLFLPFYFEDMDLGFRARKAGFKCLWEPRSRVEHKHEATINPTHFKRSYINLIKQRNYLLLVWRSLENINLAINHLFYLLRKCFLEPGYLKVVLLSLIRLVTFRKA